MSETLSSDHPLSPESSPFSSCLPDFSLKPSAKTGKFDVDLMNQAELLALHAKIEAKLTGISLADINLEKETLLQYQRAKALQEEATSASGTNRAPLNQLAQVQNSLANILGSLAKMQMELHDSESLKRLKAAVIRTVKAQPKAFQDTFFELMDRELALVAAAGDDE